MKKDNLVYIEDMLNACNKILSYTDNVAFEDLLADQILIDALIRNIEIIGEAANRLDEDFKVKHPDFPVRSAVTMRNKLVHDYNMVDPQIVWDTIRSDIPELVPLCKKLLEQSL